MLNRVILIGRLTKDPELRYTPSGVAVTQFTLAVDRPFTSQGGEREADFLPIVTWRQLAETVANYTHKGNLVAIEGRIQVRNYDNNEGKRVYVTEIVADNVRFLEGKRNSEGGNSAQGASNSSYSNNNNSSSSRQNQTPDPFSDDGKPIDISDDDLPF
ncbi:single-stranded DNA-binding protein [Paenibacillus polymyxa]|uniref:Single-stranded DNA-binding protein n=1 Tax=Paenibacillus polymyxa (strain SC2) TaxID=886882 RepID=E3EKM5_PAEPS|nr:single-stranded DNA-binding protein [Paenibacillus polymyxa]ADO59857.1 single-stranded DNA-binding protein [Paenibacillus polymyxa SC2]WPQ59914.1 single-stranded DNA-binding protein [Paenibacillus polymyxa]